MARKSKKREQPKGVTFPLIGARYRVHLDGRNVLGGYDTMDEAEAAAARHFNPKRKKNL